ncbi:MAG: hypothetical protein ABIX01_22890 [Chitinophagaceae bacterium]
MPIRKTQPGGAGYYENSGAGVSSGQNEKQTLHDFLHAAKLKQSALLATIELADGDEHLITITPFTHDGGGCGDSFIVSKDAIEWVRQTGQIKYCCGSGHEVIEVGFKEGASISIKEVFQQLSAKARTVNVSLPNTSPDGPINPYAPQDFAPPPMYRLDHYEYKYCGAKSGRRGGQIKLYQQVAVYIHRTAGRIIEKTLSGCDIPEEYIEPGAIKIG